MLTLTQSPQNPGLVEGGHSQETERAEAGIIVRYGRQVWFSGAQQGRRIRKMLESMACEHERIVEYLGPALLILMQRFVN